MSEKERALTWLRAYHGSDAVHPLNDEYVASLIAEYTTRRIIEERRGSALAPADTKGRV